MMLREVYVLDSRLCREPILTRIYTILPRTRAATTVSMMALSVWAWIFSFTYSQETLAASRSTRIDRYVRVLTLVAYQISDTF